MKRIPVHVCYYSQEQKTSNWSNERINFCKDRVV